MQYQEYKIEHKEILDKIANKKLYDYILSNLQSSLFSIGFSDEFIDYFVNNFSELDFEDFYNKFGEELTEIYDIGFFQKIVPKYFNKEVIPHIPESNTILDLGCGTGILIHSLSNSQKFKNLIGIDINKYPEWEQFNSPKIEFKIIAENEFEDFLKKTQPDNIILTWTLHHMDCEEQSRYLKEIFKIINTSSRLIILEDSYSEKLPPKNGKIIYNSFKELNPSERKIVMSVYDWIANRILARRKSVPIPFGYRTLEEWQNLCEGIGYKTIEKVFIGFPDKRDINTPQSFLIVEK
jgi:ubiquinone/menaquinone biosynthesis C-methylase UbiE